MVTVTRQDDVVLEARGIVKRFPGVLALDEVDFAARRGCLNAVVGENGAGKSTLMNVLAGVHRPDAGQLLLNGRPVAFSDTRQAQACGIAIIHQELNLVPHMSVAENIYLGREPLTPWGTVDFRRMNRGAAALLGRLEMPIEPTAPVASLRVGQQQVVEIAKALSIDARIIIMDEPTSAISEHEVDVLFSLIESLKAHGVTIIYITHKLDELSRIGERVTVLRDGKGVGSATMADLGHDDIVRMMVGRDLTDAYARAPTAAGGEVLRAEDICLAHPVRRGQYVLRDVNLSVRRGEVLGVFGLMGSGRTELLESIFGVHAHRSTGRVFVEGRQMRIRSPRDAVDAGIGLAPEDRRGQGLVLMMSVKANVTLVTLDRAERFGFVHDRLETRLADEYVRRLGIKIASLSQAVRTLSGGNQQKVILARWLASEAAVLLLDEPTRGIDVKAKRGIYELIGELTATGLGVVMVSSELPEILGVADRIMVMSEGRKTAEFSRAEATEEKIMHTAVPRSEAGAQRAVEVSDA
jgi:ribose transport system ATP-binding protein